MKIVYNAEPFGYSKKAIKAWGTKGYVYKEGSWDIIDNQTIFKDVEILIVRLKQTINEGIINKFPDLKVIVSATTGHDHLAVNLLLKRKIKLISLRGQDEFLQTIPSTAEHTWALLMALIRNIPAANEHVKAGYWDRDIFRGIQLKGKTLGVVGFGRTGRAVAEYARAFSMKVCYYDPYVNDGTDEKLESLKKVFQVADVLSFHVHINEETKKLLNTENIKDIKPGAYLLNTSRGKIWEEQAVLKALQNNKIRGVATDVLTTELAEVKQSPLWKAQENGQNVIITPHIGGATWDAMWACEEFIIKLI